MEEQVLVREVPSLQLTDIVHAEVEDIGEDLETTAMDGSISNTAAPRAALYMNHRFCKAHIYVFN